MQVKLFSLLAGLAIAGAALFTNCAKESTTPAPVTAPNTEAADRVPCAVTITVNGAAEFCGTQTNMNYCANAMNANQFGVENVVAGTYTYTVNAPSVIGVNNPTATTIKVTISTTAGVVNFLLPGGAARKYFVDAACGLTPI